MTNVTLHNTAQPTRLHTEIESGDLGVKLGPTQLAAISHSIPDYVALISPTDVSNLQLWLDPGQISTLYKDTGGTLKVTASDDPVGYAVDKSLNQDAVAASDSTRPTYKDVFQGKYLYHDRVDDKLTVPNFPAAEYTAVAAYYGGAQVWTFTHGGGTLNIFSGDFSEIVIYMGTISDSDRDALLAYMGGSPNVIWRFWSAVDAVSLSFTQVGDAGAVWFAGDMQTASGDTFTKTVTANETISLNATYPENITEIDFYNKDLFGELPDLSALTGLTYFKVNSNDFAGKISSLPDTLEYLNVQSNNLYGSLPDLSPVLTYINCAYNSISGSIPALQSALQYLWINNNDIDGSVPDLSGATGLLQIDANDNLIEGYTGGGISSTVTYFDMRNNLLTETAVDTILSDLVDAGGTNGQVLVSGTGNAAPSASGLADKAILEGRGWTVTTN